ncbi:MAG TPA: undecaprenyl-diphosphate phosphatase [Papillibacter sp.]|nr:undecaprenyl-diphosphate phosphatase [Papillibacter sp.]
MSALTAILLGLLRGITVFLPLSYSGHTALLQGFGLEIQPDPLYSLLLSLSSVLSIAIVYGGHLRKMAVDSVAFFTGRYDNPLGEGRLPTTVRTALFILIALAPALVLLPFRKYAVTLSDRVWFVCFAMMILGVLIFAADRLSRQGSKRDRTATALDALLVGLGYALGVIPGLSAVALAIAIGLTRGLHREYAVRFSVLLTVIPSMLSVFMSLLGLFRGGVDWAALPWYLIGLLLSVFLGALSIALLYRFLARRRLHKLAFYLWFVGVVALIVSSIIGE